MEPSFEFVALTIIISHSHHSHCRRLTMSSSLPSSLSASPSTPELTLSIAPTPQRTNTLIITQLTPAFYEPGVQDALRDHFAVYGFIHTWAPLKAFRRVLVVYYMEDDAETAKAACDHLVIARTQHRYDILIRQTFVDSHLVPVLRQRFECTEPTRRLLSHPLLVLLAIISCVRRSSRRTS